MSNLSPNLFALALIGIYLLYLYADLKYKSFLGLSFLCFVLIGSKIIYPDQYGKQWLLIGAPIVIISIFAIIEAQKFQNQGRAIFQPTKKNIIFGIILVSIYLLARIFYFDKM